MVDLPIQRCSLTAVVGPASFQVLVLRTSGDLVVESHGMAPIPEDQRYGSSWRNFTVWFAPNMELSGVFTGTLAFTLGLGFWPGFVAIVIGVVLGAVPVGLLATLGPKTGMGQLPLARSPIRQEHHAAGGRAMAERYGLGRACRALRCRRNPAPVPRALRGGSAHRARARRAGRILGL